MTVEKVYQNLLKKIPADLHEYITMHIDESTHISKWIGTHEGGSTASIAIYIHSNDQFTCCISEMEPTPNLKDCYRKALQDIEKFDFEDFRKRFVY